MPLGPLPTPVAGIGTPATFNTTVNDGAANTVAQLTDLDPGWYQVLFAFEYSPAGAVAIDLVAEIRSATPPFALTELAGATATTGGQIGWSWLFNSEGGTIGLRITATGADTTVAGYLLATPTSAPPA
jgi:hypothetical protein